MPYCSHCGAPMPEASGWPRTCSGCTTVHYRNPLPVAVVLVRVNGGVLTVRRAQSGLLALPGGFVNWGETWQQAGAREVYEETGLRLDAADLRLVNVLSAPDETLLIFAEASAPRLPAFEPNSEVTEVVVLDAPRELAFPLHTQVLGEWWGRR